MFVSLFFFISVFFHDSMSSFHRFTLISNFYNYIQFVKWFTALYTSKQKPNNLNEIGEKSQLFDSPMLNGNKMCLHRIETKVLYFSLLIGAHCSHCKSACKPFNERIYWSNLDFVNRIEMRMGIMMKQLMSRIFCVRV